MSTQTNPPRWQPTNDRRCAETACLCSLYARAVTRVTSATQGHSVYGVTYGAYKEDSTTAAYYVIERRYSHPTSGPAISIIAGPYVG